MSEARAFSNGAVARAHSEAALPDGRTTDTRQSNRASFLVSHRRNRNEPQTFSRCFIGADVLCSFNTCSRSGGQKAGPKRSSSTARQRRPKTFNFDGLDEDQRRQYAPSFL